MNIRTPPSPSSPGTAPLARASCDGAGRLISADEPLAGLQLRVGGTIPGALAIPALAELVARAQALGLRVAQAITAHDGEQAISAWAEAAPAEGGGTEIALRDWRAEPVSPGAEAAIHRRRAEIDQALAEFTARLDARQQVVSAEAHGPALAALAAAMNERRGQPWTDFVSLPGSAHRQPLHWRLLDGAEVRVAGAGQRWRASLQPLGDPQGPAGFALALTAIELPMPRASVVPDVPRAMIGRDVAPVLRQPIARIIANAESIRSRLAGPLGEEYCNYAGDIATAGQHLLDLVEDLADLEVVEAEDFTTAPDAIDLADVARRACGILAVRAREAGITLVAPADGEALPATAEFRRALQILLNLVGNALRYSREGSTVRIELGQSGAHAAVTVADDGPGIAAEDAARVFDKFERLGRSGDGGTGLGLYISRRLARAMGGELSVASTPGEGARFTLALPTG